MAISKKSWLGFGVETTPGVALAAPSVFHPCKSVMKGAKKREQLKEERGNRDAVYGLVDTARDGSTDPKGPFYVDTSPYLMLAAFGSTVAVQPDPENAPDVYRHLFELADIPPTLTLFKSYDAAVYVASYAAVEKWSLKINSDGKLIENEVTLKHRYPVKYEGQAITPRFTPTLPFAGYAPRIKLNGTETADITEINIEFSQKLTLWHPAHGSLDYEAVYFGEREVKCDFTARFDNDSLYQRYMKGLDDSVEITVIGNTLTTGATPLYEELKITIPQISYDSMDHDLGKDNVLVKAKTTAVSGASGLIHAEVQNKVKEYK
ncbi:hypothetical protein EI42_03157 [Thermosporothrix hazakensis]|jgi:hypothetical protein|uniref:Uncharacterized protein n=1 Tax=Thermosporothrix hazakensis TaxID=644383 RepID=A0A326U562_THEHA|nr:phage tail tube protein [Thermosporothrix hazakensis]PZW28403.1 hypothetical protein EI42_03157 [Thermosporothrix hazakensis]GCE45183.1 hypothetical protein KTH_00520 [Thermosporothrix hazakensis]